PSFTINARPTTRTTNNNSQTYGDADPAGLTTGSVDFLAADTISAPSSPTPRSSDLGGPYHITATLVDPLSKLTNYSVTNAGASFKIKGSRANWSKFDNRKTYGDADPAGLTTGSGDFLAADTISATYTRAAGESVLGG